MPFMWQKGKNPYVFNYYGKLRIGPNAQPPQIIGQARKLVQIMIARPGDLELCGEELDEHSVNEASTELRQSKAQSEELLLVHPQTQRDPRKLKSVIEQIRESAAIPEQLGPIPLQRPSAIFWLLPAPGLEAAELPEWSDFGLVAPGDKEDLDLDIVFDC